MGENIFVTLCHLLSIYPMISSILVPPIQSTNIADAKQVLNLVLCYTILLGTTNISCVVLIMLMSILSCWHLTPFDMLKHVLKWIETMLFFVPMSIQHNVKTVSFQKRQSNLRHILVLFFSSYSSPSPFLFQFFIGIICWNTSTILKQYRFDQPFLKLYFKGACKLCSLTFRPLKLQVLLGFEMITSHNLQPFASNRSNALQYEKE